MDDIAKIKSVIQKVELSQNYLINSWLSQNHQKEVYDILVAIAKTPLEYQNIFEQKTANLTRNMTNNNKQKVTVSMSLEEQQEQVHKLLVYIQMVILKLTKQLHDMVDKEYFFPQLEIKYTTHMTRKPRKGMIGDYWSYNQTPEEVIYHKQEFSSQHIDTLLKKLQKIGKEVDSLARSVQWIDTSDNEFATNGINYAQKKVKSQRDEIIDIYKTINSQFLHSELSEDMLEKPYKYQSKQHQKISELISNKTVNRADINEILNLFSGDEKVRKIGSVSIREKIDLKVWKNLIIDLPEIQEMSKISIDSTKDIENPKYAHSKREITILETTIKELQKIFAS